MKLSVPRLLIAPALLCLLAVTGCTESSTSQASTTASPTSSKSASAAPGTASGSSAPATPSSSPATGAGTPTTVAPSSARCETDHLRGSVDSRLSGQQTVEPVLILTNTGTETCTLQGWPGVSLVGGGNGSQVGAAAYQEKNDAHPTVTLQPGRAARAQIVLKLATSLPTAQCRPMDADGFRVYPPGETASLFVRFPAQGCASDAQRIMTVFALHPGS